jgi:regulator of sirC expression with transglutaminase-like and TPR domain
VGRNSFDLLMELPTEHIRLDCAALHFARDVYTHLDFDRYIAQLDALANDVGARRPGLSAPLRYQAMRDVLVEEHGFRGDMENYSDPQNSYLNRVLDRRLGVPASLSAIWIEVGRRLKWPVQGVALPGHFLVRFDDREHLVLADPFNGGRSLSIGDCRRLVNNLTDCPLRFSTRMLAPVDTRATLARMLHNLRRIYLARCDWQRLALVLRRLVAVEPDSGQHLQDLASVCARRGDMRGAYGCLHLYLRRVPDARDCDVVQSNLSRLEAAMLARN